MKIRIINYLLATILATSTLIGCMNTQPAAPKPQNNISNTKAPTWIAYEKPKNLLAAEPYVQQTEGSTDAIGKAQEERDYQIFHKCSHLLPNSDSYVKCANTVLPIHFPANKHN